MARAAADAARGGGKTAPEAREASPVRPVQLVAAGPAAPGRGVAAVAWPVSEQPRTADPGGPGGGNTSISTASPATRRVIDKQPRGSHGGPAGRTGHLHWPPGADRSLVSSPSRPD